MKVKFLHGFRGRETGEVFFEAGQVVENDNFVPLAERGIVELLPDEPPAVPEPEVKEEEKEVAKPKRKAKK